MYGDLLENYEEVKNYCDTVELDKNSSPRFLNLGGLDSCNLRNTCTTNFLDSYREQQNLIEKICEKFMPCPTTSPKLF